MDINNIWNLFLNKIENHLEPISYEIWFKETKLIELKENLAKILVPMDVHKKHLKENYNDIISKIFTEITDSIFKFEYITEEELKNNIIINTDEIGVPSLENFESNLDSRYSFDNFITGESNFFALS